MNSTPAASNVRRIPRGGSAPTLRTCRVRAGMDHVVTREGFHDDQSAIPRARQVELIAFVAVEPDAALPARPQGVVGSAQGSQRLGNVMNDAVRKNQVEIEIVRQ